MKPSVANANRLGVWGHSLLNKLPSRTRKARKRAAAKRRRVILSKADLSGEDDLK